MATHPQTDQQLIEQIHQGDEQAFATLYQRHKQWVVQLAWRFTGHEDDALDVLQETFRYVLKKSGERGGLTLTASFTTFLYPAVKNLSLAARRKRKRFIGGADELEMISAPSAEEGGENTLAGVLSHLGGAHREIVLMRFVDDMTLDEMAAALGIPIGTVKSRLHHALAALREDPRTRRYFADEVREI